MSFDDLYGDLDQESFSQEQFSVVFPLRCACIAQNESDKTKTS
jgi:hypothetical protein